MSTREVLVFPILYKRKPIKSQSSLLISLLAEWRHVDHILQFTTLEGEVGGGFILNWECSTATNQHCRDIPPAFSIWLHLSYVWMAKLPWSQGKEKEKQVSALSSCLILITPGTGQLQIHELFLADYSSHSSQYLALLSSVAYGNSKARNSNSFISFTDFNSLKVAFFVFIFILHLYFEGVLLKCIFLADNNLALHNPSSSSWSVFFRAFSIFVPWLFSPASTFLVLLCHRFHFLSSPSTSNAGNLHAAGCNARCSPLVSQLLHFLSCDIDLDFFQSPSMADK